MPFHAGNRRLLAVALAAAALPGAFARLGDPANASEVDGNDTEVPGEVYGDAPQNDTALQAAAAQVAATLPLLPGRPFVEATNESALPQVSSDILGNASTFRDEQGRVLVMASSHSTFGYSARASTTQYGNTPSTSCGGLNTAAIVAGTGYYSVASAQAMQSLFRDGSSCCYCGAGAEGAWSKGTVPMGCFTCARGRFLNQRPYNGLNDADGFKTPEIKIVVADICPGSHDKKGWCQSRPGDGNWVGERNHLDFSSYPHAGIDNNFFVFTPEACSPQLKARMHGGMSKCWR